MTPHQPQACTFCSTRAYSTYTGPTRCLRGAPLCERHWRQAMYEPKPEPATDEVTG